MTIGMKQLAKAMGFAKQLGYPSRSTIFREGQDDYLSCFPDSLETKACCCIARNISFSKLEAMLSLMPSKEFSD